MKRRIEMKGLNNITLGKKLMGGFGFCVLIIIGLVSYNYVQLSHLRSLQDDGAKRSMDALVAEEAASGGTKLYQVAADT
ncbi:hypothetical protein EG830_11490, partial [bacterium]|nr:hypothetical protein [bacterium]